MPALCPISQAVYCCREDAQRQVVVLVSLPQVRGTTDQPKTLERGSSSVDAEDLTTRCSISTELQTNDVERLRGTTSGVDDARDRSTVVTTPSGRLSTVSNPVFGTSKSPKSYWLRRHSDSVFADDCDPTQRGGDDAVPPSWVKRAGKERTVSDSQSAGCRELDASGSASALQQPALMRRFHAALVGMQLTGESDEVFDESPALQTTHDDVNIAPPRSDETSTTTYAQLDESSLQRRRARLTVVSSSGNLEDIVEERPSPDLSLDDDKSRDGDGAADASMFAKPEVNDVNDQPLNDGVRSIELSGGASWQCADDAACRDAENRKLNELARPEAASPRGGVAATCRRVPRVARSARLSAPAEPSRQRGGDAVSSGAGGKVHRCTVCRRTFSRSDMLERHARLHTGVRPYACRLCTQVFSRSDHLTTHLRTHTGEKPYACPRCAYTASRRDMVTRHLRVHESLPAADAAASVCGVVGPPRRRIYRSRYKERLNRPAVPGLDVDAAAADDRVTSYVPSKVDEQRLNGVTLTWPSAQRQRNPPTVSLPPPPSPPPAAAQTAVIRRRLEHLQAPSRCVVARGSTGSTDSYSSPVSLSASDVFEFAVSYSGVEGSPDVFRSPSATRQPTRFIFPYTAASTALSICDPTDTF